MKKILLWIIVVLLLVAGGIFYYILNSTTPTIFEKKVVDSSAPAVKTLAEIQQEKQEQARKDASAYNAAQTQRDPKLCEDITASDKRIECREMIQIGDIVNSGSVDDCKVLTNTGILIMCQDRVHWKIAVKLRTKALCDSISDSTLQLNCREEIDAPIFKNLIENNKATQSACYQLEEKYQSNCLASIRTNQDQENYTKALSNNSISYCSLISDATLKSNCSDTLLMKQALQGNDSAICDRISDENKRSYCTSHVTARNETTLFQEYVKTNNLDGCMSLNDEALRNRCHDMVTLNLAGKNKDATLCSTLTNTGMIAMCERMATVP